MFNSYSNQTTPSSSLKVQYLWKRLWNILKRISEHEEKVATTVADLSSSSSSSSMAHAIPVLFPTPPATKIYRRRKQSMVHSTNLPFCKDQKNTLIVPPFSPTYYQPNHFPYSNFYMKLPDDRWMLRFRDGNRCILRTDVIQGHLI